MAQPKLPITIYASQIQYNASTNEYYITFNDCQVVNTDSTNNSVQIKINKNQINNIPSTSNKKKKENRRNSKKSKTKNTRKVMNEIDTKINKNELTNADNDTLLICGFCHQFEQLLFNEYIPETLIELCQAYCHNKSNNKCINYSICSPIITMAIGGCGINLANTFFTSLFDEFQNEKTKTSTNPNDKLCSIAPIKGEPYFSLRDGYNNKINYLRYLPWDCDPAESLDAIKYCRVAGQYVKPDNFVFHCEAAQTWSKAYYDLGAELMDEIMDIYRKESEIQNSPHAIQMFHSLDGGTGSGLSSLIMKQFRDHYTGNILKSKDANIYNFTIFPGKTRMDTTPYATYNSLLSLSFLNKYSDSVFVFDNSSLNSIVKNKYSQRQFANNYKVRLNNATTASVVEPVNNIVTASMIDIASLFRTKYTMNDVKGILNPFGDEYMKYYALSSIPLNKKESMVNDTYEFTKLLFESDALFCNCKSLKKSVNMATMVIHRNYCLEKSVIKRIENEMIPNRINDIVSVFTESNTLNGDKSATMITNTCGMKNTINMVAKKFDKMFRRKAYVHSFTSDGMELDEFVEARQSVENLINKYSTISIHSP